MRNESIGDMYADLYADAAAAGFVPDPSENIGYLDYEAVDNYILAEYANALAVTEPDIHGFVAEPLFVDVKRVQKSGKTRITFLDTIPNTAAVLQAMGITPRYNVMTRQDEYIGGIAEGRQPDSVVTRVISAAKSRGYRSADMVSHLSEIAISNAFHPVRAWLHGVQWDGQSRIQQLADTLHTDNKTLTVILLRRWAIGAMQAVILDNPSPQQGVLVIVGAQGKGKTTWIKSLCPIPGAVMTGVELDPHKPDSVQKSTVAWITELGEIDGTMRRSDIATLKAFVTNDSDTYRMPYARLPRTYPRRTAFAASVNDSAYLKDDTGNRRWWTIPVQSIDRHGVDMQQFWAEVAALVEAGEPHSLQADELAMLNALNSEHEVLDTYQEMILLQYGHHQDAVAVGVPLEPMTTTMIAESLGYRQPTPAIVRAVGVALAKCGYSRDSIRLGKTPSKGYLMPPKLQT